ncbi:hypothetical protein CASFOL_014497 [Castilleja foliolosa]|uniref:SWIM-type domain-containing protein n=1 Tax=Castilleja foliolosa TaxID=1961234 RepID=A0ABD3DQP7_9LAMI
MEDNPTDHASTMEDNPTDHASTSTAMPQANVEIHAEGDVVDQIDGTGSPSSQIQVNVKIVFSPGSRKYYVPICEPSLKPYVGQKFPDLDTGIEFYRRYAANCGFDIRLGTSRRARDNTIQKKYVFCSREGEKYTTPSGKISDTQAQKSTTSKSNDVQSEMSPINKSNDMQVEKSTRNRPTTRLGCEERIIFDLSTYSTYVVAIFEEQHNHPLCSERYRQFLKTNRNMNPGHQSFVLNCAKVNMGPTKSFRLYREIVGDYSSIGCTSVEFKNFGRDLKAYTEGCDAQMILDNLCSKRELSSAFFFDFDTDDNDQLTRLFWADPISRRNYTAFGDVVSFDATYSTNRYNLIFAPFTGIDNHRRIVTFGAGLLSKEDSDSYAWLIGKFKECMGRQPLMITTDQDLGMRKAIESVLPDTRHRYCMWHIDKKITERVPQCKNAESSFRAKINEVIWSDLLEPSEFEKAWGDVLTEFNLNNQTWLGKIFEVRHNWIPAYFRDNPMSGLARTTSISESVNSFFDKYLNRSSNLVEFFMKYDNAIAAQRHAQDKLNSETTISIPAMKTQLPIERHAMELYTSRIFIDVQEEISAACFSCTILAICNEGSSCTYQISDGTSTVEVVYDSVEDSYTCSCRKYVRWGLLCRHIFVLFKERKVRFIPDKYIVSRWTKNALNTVSLTSGLNIIEKTDPLEKHKIVLGQLYSEFYHTIGVVGNDTETLESIMCSLKDHRERKSNVDTSQNTKRRLFEDHFGAQVPDKGSVTIHPPAPVHNKGSGKRIKSAAEIAFENSKKTLRLCRKCNQRTNHDSRNCDKFTGSANRTTDTNTDVSLED